METLTKTKIGFRQGDWNHLNNGIEKSRPIMQPLWEHLATSGLEVSKVDVEQLLSAPLDYLIGQMPEDFQKTAAFVEKTSLKFPSRIQQLTSAVPGLQQEIKNFEAHRWISYYRFDDDGITIKDEELGKLREQCTDYCDNYTQLECYELTSKISELLNELNKKYFNVGVYAEWSPRLNPLDKVFAYEGQEFKAKADFIKQQR